MCSPRPRRSIPCSKFQDSSYLKIYRESYHQMCLYFPSFLYQTKIDTPLSIIPCTSCAMGKPGATLLSLPDETLLQIAEHIIGLNIRSSEFVYGVGIIRFLKRAARESSNLALTNRHLGRIIEPLLYTAVTNHAPFKNKLLRRISHAPAIAEHIRYIEWKEKRPRLDFLQMMAGLTISDERWRFPPGDGGWPVPIPDISIAPSLQPSYYMTQDHDEDLAALLSRTPNIRWLEVAQPNSDWHLWSPYQYPEKRASISFEARLPRWLHYIDQATHPNYALIFSMCLQHLHVVHVGVGTTPLIWISCILRLPSLERLTLDRVLQVYELDPQMQTLWCCPLRSSSVRELYITESFIDISATTRLVESPKALVHFHLHFTERYVPYRWWHEAPNLRFPTLNLRRFTQCITQHSDTLKTLGCWVTRNRGHAFWPIIFEHNIGHLGSLASLHRLQYLGTNLGLINAYDIPRNVIAIKLFTYDFRCQTYLEKRALDNFPDIAKRRLLRLRDMRLFFETGPEFFGPRFYEPGGGCEIISHLLDKGLSVTAHNEEERFDVHYRGYGHAFCGRYNFGSGGRISGFAVMNTRQFH